MLQRRPDGAMIYLTDREELEEMPLLRADGLPTQHMRALAYWMAAPGLEGTTSIQVCGLEWVAHVTCRRQLMDEMMAKGAGADINHPAHDIFHGMVSKQSESVSSSKKNALLIDELAEWIDDGDGGRGGARRRCARGHPAAEAIVPQVALGYFLMHTNTKPLDFEPEKLLREEQSLGWDLAGARAHNGNGSGAADGRAGRGPRLPLRRRPVGDVPAPPAAGGRAARRQPAGPLRRPPLALVPRGGPRAARAGGVQARSRRAPAASGLEAAR